MAEEETWPGHVRVQRFPRDTVRLLTIALCISCLNITIRNFYIYKTAIMEGILVIAAIIKAKRVNRLERERERCRKKESNEDIIYINIFLHESILSKDMNNYRGENATCNNWHL